MQLGGGKDESQEMVTGKMEAVGIFDTCGFNLR